MVLVRKECLTYVCFLYKTAANKKEKASFLFQPDTYSGFIGAGIEFYAEKAAEALTAQISTC